MGAVLVARVSAEQGALVCRALSGGRSQVLAKWCSVCSSWDTHLIESVGGLALTARYLSDGQDSHKLAMTLDSTLSVPRGV